MRDILQGYSPTNNFWKENPQFTTIQPLKGFWKSDRTKGKLYSSNVMWAIALIYHPKSDVYYLDNKEENILNNLLGIKEEDVEKFFEERKQIIETFKDIVVSQAEKSLLSWETRLKDRDAFLSEQHYTFGYDKEVDGISYSFKDNTRALDDMASKTAKLYEEYFKIQAELEKEHHQEGTNNKGYDSTNIKI